VGLNLFGGEPLLEFDALVALLQEASAASARHGASLEAQIVTNGYLLSRERSATLRALGVDVAQITIDGSREHHNNRRSQGRDTYERIWSNVVDACLAGLDVIVLTVVDGENVDDLPAHVRTAADYASQHAEVARHLMLQFGEVFETSETLIRTSEVLLNQRSHVAEGRFAAYRLAQDLGLRTNNPFGVNACARESEDSVLIGPDGALYKCFSTIGDARYRIGSVYDDPADSLGGTGREFAQIRPFDGHAPCRGCDLLPYCRSGCQFVASLYNDGVFGAPLCEYERLREEVRLILVNEIRDGES
jgi:uncharacterized protein